MSLSKNKCHQVTMERKISFKKVGRCVKAALPEFARQWSLMPINLWGALTRSFPEYESFRRLFWEHGCWPLSSTDPPFTCVSRGQSPWGGDVQSCLLSISLTGWTKERRSKRRNAHHMGMGMALFKEGAKTTPCLLVGGFLSLKGPGQGPQLRGSRSFADSSSSLPANVAAKMTGVKLLYTELNSVPYS